MDPETSVNVGSAPLKNLIPHTSVNDKGISSILLVHGAFVDRCNWDQITPYLKDYHLLLPDLPYHGEAQSTRPFSIDLAARLFSELIQARAVGGVAHVVGHSLGASVSLRLATVYPHVVKSLLISGYGNLQERRLIAPCLPYLAWLETRVRVGTPRHILRRLTNSSSIPRNDSDQVPMELIRQVVTELSSEKPPHSWPARTLVIVATKPVFLPTGDSVAPAKKVAVVGKESNAKTIAVAHPKIRHAWNLQAPELFAETIRAWIEDKPAPPGFAQL